MRAQISTVAHVLTHPLRSRLSGVPFIGIVNDKGRFYEKVIKVKADVAALLIFLVLCGFRHISAENFALGSLRSDDWQLGRPTAPPLLSVFRVFSPPNASSLPCCIDPVVTGGAVKGAAEGRRSS
jgi:hypothetical protein